MSAEERGAPVTTPPTEGYIGKSVVRRETARLQAGRGVFTDDLTLPRMTHVAFFRSPHAHARIVSIDTAEAKALPGVLAVVTGEEMARVCQGWVGTLAHFAVVPSCDVQPRTPQSSQPWPPCIWTLLNSLHSQVFFRLHTRWSIMKDGTP